MRLIDADALGIGKANRDVFDKPEYADGWNIEEAPTVDAVEVVHGEWIEVRQTGRNSRHIKYTTKKCSVCGYWNGRRKTNFCPNCGAKMDAERKVSE